MRVILCDGCGGDIDPLRVGLEVICYVSDPDKIEVRRHYCIGSCTAKIAEALKSRARAEESWM